MAANSEIGKYLYYVYYYASDAVKNVPIKNNFYFSNYAINRVNKKANTFNSNISKEIKQQYADFLSAIYGRTDAGNAKYNPQEMRDAIERLMENEIEKSLGQIEWYTGRVLNGQGQKEGSSSSGRVTTEYISPQDEQKIKSKINSLNIAIKKLGAKKGLTEKEIKELLDRVEDIGQKLDLAITYAKKNPDLLKVLPKGRFGAGRTNKKYFYIGRNSELNLALRELNELLAEYRFIGKVNTYQTGFLGEATALGAAYMITGLAEKSIDEALAEAMSSGLNPTSTAGALTGGVQTKLTWKTSGLAKDAEEQLWFNYKDEFIKDDTRIVVENQGSQQKIDVIAYLPSKQDDTQVFPVKMSVKNINLASDFGIHLVSGTNIWQLIQDEDPAYLRRYLNVYADRSETIYSNRKNEFASRIELSKYRDDAHLSLKILSAYKALSGDIFGRSAAQLFVVNDSGNQNIYVVEIADILNSIINQATKTRNIDNYFDYKISSIKLFKNNWQETLHHRMATLINDVHSRNISVIFKNNAFTTLAKEIGVNNIMT